MTLYFYCNSPLEGFHFLQVDPQTGNTVANETTDKLEIDPLIYRMITLNGANMALCHKQNEHTFFIRHICSPGKNERIGFVMQNAEEKLARQFAAWAIFDYPAFCAAVLRCVEVSGGICSIHPVYVQQLLQNKMEISSAASQEELYRTLITQVSSNAKPYDLLVVDYDIADFNANLNMSVDPTMVECLMSMAQLKELQKKVLSVNSDDLPKQDSPLPPPKEEKEEKVEEEKPPVQQRQADDSKRIPSHPTVSHEKQPAKQTVASEEETVDLLQTKWFIPVVACIIVALVVAVVCIISFSRAQKPEQQVSVAEPTTIVETGEPAI